MGDSALFDQAVAPLRTLSEERRALYAEVLAIAAALVDVVAEGPPATGSGACGVEPVNQIEAEPPTAGTAPGSSR